MFKFKFHYCYKFTASMIVNLDSNTVCYQYRYCYQLYYRYSSTTNGTYCTENTDYNAISFNYLHNKCYVVAKY